MTEAWNKAEAWSVARIDQLRLLWSTSASCASIAAELGGGLSRSAIIGKAARLKLPSRRPGNPDGSAQIRTPAQEQRRLARREAARVPEWVVVPEQPVIPVLRADEPLPLNLTLLALTRTTCRWPNGSGPFVFCGHTVVAKQSYCPHHMGRSLAASSRRS